MKIRLLNTRLIVMLLIPAVLAGVAGCNKSSDTSPTVTTVTTDAIISNLTTTTAESGGYVTNFIANTIGQYGVCWSATNKTPTVGDGLTNQNVANTIHFSSAVTGLTPNTLYYLRAYAIGTDKSVTYGNVIQFTTPTTTFSLNATVSTFAGSGVAGAVDGTGKAAQLSAPQNIVADASGNLYVADSFNNLIRKITSAGVVITLAGNVTPGFTNGTGTAAQFYSPQGLAIDTQGNLYVSDVGNNAIRKVTPAGVVTTLAGGNGAGYADGSGATVKFYNPAGLAVDAQGTVYVADKSNNLIRKVTAAGVVTTLVGVTTPGYADAPTTYTTGNVAQFRSPMGLALDAKGNLFVADVQNNAIRQITLADGTVSTFVGDILSDATILNSPVAMSIDSKGNFFIADVTGRILEIVAATNIMYTIAGKANTTGYTDGAGTSATFNGPQGVVTDAQGNIYVSDNNNNVIRKITVTTTP